jgi:arylsulfatase A-like enzyme
MTAPRPSRREFLRQTGTLGVALGLGEWISGCAPAGGAPPNVVLIFTDDQGYGDVGIYGATGFRTPNLDRLAAEGMRFTDFYASQAVCSASRASLLTGCYAERVGIQGALGPGAEHGLSESETTIAEMLKDRGYATAMVGKWHLGHLEEYLPLQHGFDEYFGLPYSNDMWPVDYDGSPAVEGNKLQYPPLPLIEGNQRVELVETLDDQAELTVRYTERAVDFIDRNAGGPFFLYLAHSMPHVPLGVSDAFQGSSDQGMYGDVMEEIDWSVGRILDALERHGIADDTLVIFTSDNGPWLNYGNHAGSTGPLREGKGTAFEGGPRVPAIIRWPGRVAPGSVSRRMASTLDILPTVAAATHSALPPLEIDGVSILPVLEGDTAAEPRSVFYFYYGRELRAVREGRWKRVYEHRTRSYLGVAPGTDGYPGPYTFPVVPDALYDLESDIGETTDVSARHPEVVARLDALAEDARAALGDRLTGRVGEEVREPARRRFDRPDDVEHLGVGAVVTLAQPPSPQYAAGGAAALTDGRFGSRVHDDPRWLGFSGTDLDATVDLGQVMRIGRVALDCLQAQGSWIFLPRSVAIQASRDGESWTPLGTVETAPDPDDQRRATSLEVRFSVVEARFVRVRAAPHTLPAWHAGAGEGAWVFADEILIREG